MSKRQQLIQIIEQMRDAAEALDAEKVRALNQTYTQKVMELFGENPLDHPEDLDLCRTYFNTTGTIDNYTLLMSQGKKELARIKST